MKHIPKDESTQLEVMKFEEALKIKSNDEYDRNKWLYIPEVYSEYRYILGTVGERPLITIGINPSTAKPNELDNTLKSVQRIMVGNGYDSFIMFNEYAQRATEPTKMDKIFNRKLHEENMKAFRWLLSKYTSTAIWAAWGTYVEMRPYLKECLEAMELDADEMMPCASPVGYIAKKMSIRENMMRKAVKVDERLPFEELFYDGFMNAPLTVEKAGKLAIPLEMVRLTPSAVNKQPWRVIVEDEMVHFYLKRSKGFGKEGKLDMQMIDMGIALCHFELAAKECGLKIEFVQKAPDTIWRDAEYIASYKVCGLLTLLFND